MIDIPTLFILGAGASSPYGYPTGSELRTDIIKKSSDYFAGMQSIIRLSTGNSYKIQEIISRFVDTFSESPLESIDKYLSLNPGIAPYGKMAITLSILNCERNSTLPGNIKNPSRDWFFYLFNRMMDGLIYPGGYKKFRENKVAFITFNYDRSLEFFLYNGFYNSFHQDKDEFIGNIEEYVPFPIIHVYGQVDTLNWPDHNYRYEYDFKDYELIKRLSEGISVIGEEREGKSIKEQIKELLPVYKRIYFLGFGYAQENLDALGLYANIDHEWTMHGTAKNKTNGEIRDIKKRLFNIRGNTRGGVKLLKPLVGTKEDAGSIIEDDDCLFLLREYPV